MGKYGTLIPSNYNAFCNENLHYWCNHSCTQVPVTILLTLFHLKIVYILSRANKSLIKPGNHLTTGKFNKTFVIIQSSYDSWEIWYKRLWIRIKLQFKFFCLFKHNQQDATLHNGIQYYKCSTCFRRFLRPSSGAQNCINSRGHLSRFYCFLPLVWVSWDWFACA